MLFKIILSIFLVFIGISYLLIFLSCLLVIPYSKVIFEEKEGVKKQFILTLLLSAGALIFVTGTFFQIFEFQKELGGFLVSLGLLFLLPEFIKQVLTDRRPRKKKENAD